jgi:hypothetical protein
MQEADAVLHSTHQQLIQMLNSKELVTVNPQKVSVSPNVDWDQFVQQRDLKISELTSCARSVLLWSLNSTFFAFNSFVCHFVIDRFWSLKFSNPSGKTKRKI